MRQRLVRRRWRRFGGIPFLAVMLSALPFAGATTWAATGSVTSATESITLADGTTRTYQVYRPASYDGSTAMPLLLVFHGGGGNGRQIEKQTGFDAVAEQNGFIAVYPDGSNRANTGLLRTWNAGHCCGYAQTAGIDDVGFVTALLDQLEARYRIDAGRIYATGFSNGAMLASRLGCELADRIAAIAPVSGAIPMENCAPARPLAVLIIHGKADPRVPFNGGSDHEGFEVGLNYPAVPDVAAAWAKLDGCGSIPSVTTDGAVTTTSYAGCTDGAAVALLAIAGGGHAWPGGTRAAMNGEPSSIVASRAIWAFLSTHQMPS